MNEKNSIHVLLDDLISKWGAGAQKKIAKQAGLSEGYISRQKGVGRLTFIINQKGDICSWYRRNDVNRNKKAPTA